MTHKVTLTSANHKKQHSFEFYIRDNKITFMTPDGKEIANLIVETVEEDIAVKEDSIDVIKYKVVPTEHFFLTYKIANGMKLFDDTAFVECPTIGSK